MADIDWPALLDEGVTHLRRMIQMDTTNPPGNEMQVARYLETALVAEGIETQIVVPVENRAALIARIRGNGRAEPILITAHMDVVSVERAEWSADPFGGEIRDGYIYGRGAFDDKGMLAAELMTMLLLKRQGVAGDRDVIFLASSDEESGGKWGIGWLIENHPESIRAEYAINEGGRIRIVGGRPLYAAIQNTEKAPNVVTVSATGPAGHASIPLDDNAVGRLARAVASIAAHREPVTLLPTTREFFARLGALWTDKREGQAMLDVASGDAERAARGSEVLTRVPLYNAMLRTGISPTVLKGGSQHNVIPASASAVMSVRTLPGERIDDVVQRLRALVNDERVTIEVTARGLDAPASDFQSPMFGAIRDAIADLDPSLATVPYMSTGATESAKLRAWGVATYGILPFPMDEDNERRMHGADERLALSAFEFGIKLLYGIVRRI